jgi:hypothetical protein
LPKLIDKIPKIIVLFSANENGIVDSVKIVRGYDSIFNNEAIRVIKAIPKWDIHFKHGKFERFENGSCIFFSLENRRKYKKQQIYDGQKPSP